MLGQLLQRLVAPDDRVLFTILAFALAYALWGAYRARFQRREDG